MKLNKNDGLDFIFETKDGKHVTAFISRDKIINLLEDEAYEIITTPECNSSSCAVNNFCECDPINDDAELKYVSLNKNE
ncbi:MAG: hypothetical protein ACOC22_03535 [bacterium]